MARSDQHIEQIGSAIRAQAQQQSREIIAQANRYKEDTLQQYTAQLTDELCATVQDTVRSSKKQVLRDISQAEREEYQALLHRREELTDRVYAEVARQLRDFSASGGYAPWLLERVRELQSLCEHTGSTVWLRGADMALAPQVASLLPGCRVEESDQIRIGGFILQNTTAGIRAEETLEARLAAQKPWFLMRCGLRVRQEKGDAQ